MDGHSASGHLTIALLKYNEDTHKHKNQVVTVTSSKQAVWASFGPNPRKSPLRTPKKVLKVYLEHIFEIFHFNIIPITLYRSIMSYFNKYIHIYGGNLSILWSPLKKRTPPQKKFEILTKTLLTLTEYFLN